MLKYKGVNRLSKLGELVPKTGERLNGKNKDFNCQNKDLTKVFKTGGTIDPQPWIVYVSA